MILYHALNTTDKSPTPIAYRKRCSRLGFSSKSKLYEADDHFLLVEGWIWQRCRRFYFDRVQAIIVRPTLRSTLELVTVGLPVVAAALIGLAVADRGTSEDLIATAVLSSPLVALFLFSLIRFFIYGSSQDVFLKTAVQTTRVPPLGFRKRSRRHLDEMRKVIESAQSAQEGSVVPDTIPAVPPDFPPL